jgi:U4/U6 small nuclear ribonucleoprotein PRP31
MSTLADELLNDFEDSGSEGGEQESETLFQNVEETNVNGADRGASKTRGPTGSMELDDDEEDVGDVDEELLLSEGLNNESGGAAEDEEETKAKVEKMELGSVSDVRNVAGLMKTLEPVLKVSSYVNTILATSSEFTTVGIIDLTLSVAL